MSTAVSPINPQKYGRLLAKVRPTVIGSEEENDRVRTLVERLMEKGEDLTPEEGELLRLLGRLIADFEARFYHLEDAEPHEVLRELMDARRLTASGQLVRRRQRRWQKSSTCLPNCLSSCDAQVRNHYLLEQRR